MDDEASLASYGNNHLLVDVSCLYMAKLFERMATVGGLIWSPNRETLLSAINIFLGPLYYFPDLRQIGEELHAMIKKLITEELNSAKQQQVSGGPMALKVVVMGSNLAGCQLSFVLVLFTQLCVHKRVPRGGALPLCLFIF